jgi:hypothetical protein
MDLLQIVVVLLVFGAVIWLLQAYVLPPLPSPIRALIIGILVVAMCLWLLSAVGVIGSLRVPVRR